ncbi:hypothetical protein NRIC_31540 [Enterococcus florum]|uniref:SpaA-like prealbumin fold domain-containing protein n=1 Tax=Enterococcus florum TaxID=2480627 RepID=A0A4P5PQT2_9ENTE|nr:SpaA isopeptide-forming pilin-related protein [Enterococcus florum]GCF95263.1 hypothetical protein NRIC_31540 [Enterococcus florum]
MDNKKWLKRSSWLIVAFVCLVYIFTFPRGTVLRAEDTSTGTAETVRTTQTTKAKKAAKTAASTSTKESSKSKETRKSKSSTDKEETTDSSTTSVKETEKEDEKELVKPKGVNPYSIADREFIPIIGQNKYGNPPKVEMMEDFKVETLSRAPKAKSGIGVQNTGTDRANRLEVTNWNILDSANQPISATHAALGGENYTLTFDWNMVLPEGQTLKANDYFRIKLPKNAIIGGWEPNPADFSDFAARVNGQDVVIGKWRVTEDPNPTVAGEKCVEVIFNENCGQLAINSITGIRFTTATGSLKNYTLKEILQDVTFGGITKSIQFMAKKMILSDGWDAKFAAQVSNNQVHWEIGVNVAGSNELAGDKGDWRRYPDVDSGFGMQGDAQPYDWGEHFTDIDGTFVEDQLDPGVTIQALYISAKTYLPMDMPPTDHSVAHLQHGGVASKESAYESYLLMDTGNGPMYREDGAHTDALKYIQGPKQEHSFRLIKQNSGESEADFKARVKSAPRQYGIYTTGSGASAARKVMIHFGKIGKNGDMPKMSDLTDEKYSKSGRDYFNLRTGQPVKISDFAVDAADYAIKNGFYDESDRKMLEDYFTITYGDSNCIDGQAATFFVSMVTQYPPESLSGQKINTANLPMTSGQLAGVPVGDIYGFADLTNPYAEIVLNSNSAMLLKLDQDTQEALNGFQFKLQKNEGGVWQDVQTGLVTGQIYDDSSKSFEGGIRVDSLATGTYRFVETNCPITYDPTESVDYNSSLNAVVSKEFTIPGTNQSNVVYVRNKKKPVAKYKIEHYVQKSTDSEDISNFELRDTEGPLYGMVGQSVTATPKIYVGYEERNCSYTVRTGNILADGSLVLKLYYFINEDFIPFTLYKVDENNQVMPSDSNKKVEFQLYKYIGTNPAGAVGDPNAPPDGTSWQYIKNITTDDQGRIRDKTIDMNGESYALVETVSYPGYHVPSNTEAYWVIHTAGGLPVWITTKGSDNPGVNHTYDGNGRYAGQIKNRRVGELTFYKQDEEGNKMPSDSQKKVGFKIYEFLGNDIGWNTPENQTNLNNTMYWKKVKNGDTFYTDSTGKVTTGETFKTKKIYAVQEVETYPDFTFEATGFWVFRSNNDLTFQENLSYVGQINPGYVKPSESDTGYHHLINKKNLKNFTFIKENEKKEALSDVHFALYQGKTGKTWTSENTDPLHADTYWDLDTPVGTDISGLDGRVSFTQLKNGRYLLMETKAKVGYQLPTGQWVIEVTSSGITITAQGNPLPPAFYTTNSGTEIVYHLPNYKKFVMPHAGSADKLINTIVGITILGSSMMVMCGAQKDKRKKS